MSHITLSLDQLLGEDDQATDEAGRIIAAATDDVIALLPGHDFAVLAKGNPGYRGFDWQAYLLASRRRIWLLHKILCRHGFHQARILDQGSLFGNFALSLQRLGHTVTAADDYTGHGGGLDSWVALMKTNGVTIQDCDLAVSRLPFPESHFDCVTSMGVIEHIPHTPRMYLNELTRTLRTDGLLIVETPNLLYQAKRDALANGRSIFQDIRHQFWCEPPFTGHHREYTPAELSWMLGQVRLECLGIFSYDYSHLSSSRRDEAQWRQHQQRVLLPDTQELLVGVGKKVDDPASGTPSAEMPPEQSDSHGAPPVQNFDPLHEIRDFQPAAAILSTAPDHLRIETTANQFLYAAMSGEFPAITQPGLALLMDLEIESGACSVGLLYVPRDEMVLSQPIRGSGRKKLILPINANTGNGTMRLIISNFADSAPAQSVIRLYTASVVRLLPSAKHRGKPL